MDDQGRHRLRRAGPARQRRPDGGGSAGAGGGSITLSPENQWLVTVEGAHIAVTDATGAIKSIAKQDVDTVLIETSDSGPWGTDFWWLFLDDTKHLVCAVPQGATGERTMIDWLFSLPRFDHGSMIRANRSTGNALFEVWSADAD